ncbi:hypothetical protein BC835DRAFT_1303889 [Cytidiella melzeri]|nr:hypothetical protein BC835DRAFT_1303889 [Cytidiella melzeri]
MADTFQPSLAPQARDSSNILLDVTGSALIGSCHGTSRQHSQYIAAARHLKFSQTYSYFNEYRDDDIWTKASVWFVTLLNILHSICVCMATYSVARFSMNSQNWTYHAPTGLFRSVNECYAALSSTHASWRSGSDGHTFADKKVQKPVITVIVVTIVLHVGFGIGCTRLGLVAADSLVSVTLCLALPKDSVVFRQTKSVVYTIVICAVSRGILTSAAAMAYRSQVKKTHNYTDPFPHQFSVAPHALWVACAEFVAAGCYANSFLSALTIRKRIRKQAAGNIAMQTMSIPLRSYIPSASMSNDDREDIAGAIPKSTPTDARTKVDVFGLHTCDDAFEKAGAS